MEKRYLDFAVRIAAKAGRLLLADFRKMKSVNRDPAISSRYDKKTDKYLISEIEKNFPNHSYLTEESGLRRKSKDFLWVIDPLDGTNNFLNNNPFFAVSVSLWFKNKPILGVIEAPHLKERYIALQSRGSWLIKEKKEKAKVSLIKDLSKSYLLFCDGHKAKKKSMLKFLNRLYPQAGGMRKLGSAAIELAWVGLGRAEAFILPGGYIWDVGAGILFVREAGGRVLDFNLKPVKWENLIGKRKFNVLAVNKSLKLGRIPY